MSGAADVIIAASETDADMYYATQFLAPDAFICIIIDGTKHLLMNDLEVDRAKTQARVDVVHAYSALAQALDDRPTMYRVIATFLQDHGADTVSVPAAMCIQHVEGLRQEQLDVTFRADPFFPERLIKTDEEVAHITTAIQHTEAAIASAIELIRHSEIEGDQLILGGKPLTVEYIKKVMHMQLMERDCVAQHTIVACGVQACDPHNEGSGPLRPHQAIVLDVFPRHAHSRYFADISRTVVRGTPSDKLQRMYDAVVHGQDIAFGMIKAGVDGAAVHNTILDYFEQAGFTTGVQDGRMQGFFHGTGHGLGLDIHEAPRIGGRSDILQAGTIVTVEPGLYYLDAGGVRIEDDVVVTNDGCRSLSTAPKTLVL
jgi:Xaa-Pro aminopeptidase